MNYRVIGKVSRDQILSKISERLGELGREIEEYREIQRVEREKRALEMALYARRKQANQAEIDHIKDEKRKLYNDKETLNA